MQMITIDLQQGTRCWEEHRDKHFNASDAPAMLGLSPYKTRAKLLHELATGISEEVDSATQRRFDDGHRFEALARPLAEKIIGDDLYPIVGADGDLSASFDGITMADSIIFEHKTLNKSLAKLDWLNDANDFLPDHYLAQMEQQMLISGAHKCLFMASKWDDEDNFIEERHCWYSGNEAMRNRIISGWQQFKKDLADYTPLEIIEKPQVEAMESFLVPSIQVKGEIAIITNLDRFSLQLRSFVGNLTKDPQDDQDFANLEAAVKKLKDAEDALEKSEGFALAQFEDVNTMRQTVAELKELARSHRLTSEKLVKTQKEIIKTRIIMDVRNRFLDHINELQKESN